MAAFTEWYFQSVTKKYDVVNVGNCGNNYEVKNGGIYFWKLNW